MGNSSTCSVCGRWKPVCICTGGKGTSIQVFKPMVYHDICEHPILIESKKQLRDECKKHGVIAARLL